MAYKKNSVLPRAVLLLASFGPIFCGSAIAQAPASGFDADRINPDAVMIPGGKPPVSLVEPKAVFSQAHSPANAHLDRILLLLKPSEIQQQALNARLDDLQNPASLAYHQWLTPEAFAEAFSISTAGMAQVSGWLESKGFQVAAWPTGRGWIEFSGTAAQVEDAFATKVDSITTADGTRFVLAADIHIPAALAPLVRGLVSLDGALATPAVTEPQRISQAQADVIAQKDLSRAAAITPQLAAQLLHFDSLHRLALTGAGQQIAIPSRSNLQPADIAAFRAVFGLPASPVQVQLNGIDPGETADEAETTLTASWAGAIAPGAQVVVETAATTSATDGLDLALASIVDRAASHVVIVGYSSCEASLAPAHQAFYATLYRQAAAEGISMVAAAGDSGSAACHLAGSPTPVSSGYGVNALASTPWNTAAGAAGFDDSGPSSEPSSLAAWSSLSARDGSNDSEAAYAGGGGSSSLYAEPAWQPIPPQMQTGMAETHNRLLPDVALPTAIDSTVHSQGNLRVNPGLAFCLSRDASSTACNLVRAGGSAASAALLAGIAAIVNQKYGVQGNLAPHLYAIGRSSQVFSDISQGSAELQCLVGSPNCSLDGRIGFSTTAGYDLATGLGMVNAQALVSRWASPQANGAGAATVNLSVSPTALNSTYNPSATVTLTAMVVSGNGGAIPTGTVTFLDTSEMQPVSVTPSTLDSTGTATLTTEGKFGPGGNEITAEYSGDSTYAASSSTPPVNVNIEPSTTSLAVVPSATSVTPGQTITVTATLTVGSPAEGSVAPSGLVTLDLDGLPTTTASLVTTSGVTSATFSLVIPAVSTLATHALQAVYAGNTNYSASTSPAVSVTVSKAVTTTTVTPASTTPSAGSSLMVTATVTGTSSGTATPTGTVNFLLDNVSQGIVPVTTATSTTASMTIPSIAAGAHALVAAYSGDSNFAASTSAPVSVTASKGATVTTVTATPPILALGSTETLTATVAPVVTVTGTVYTLTGTVSFYDGGTTLLGTAAIASGSASLAGVTLASNVSHSITAIYSGDTNWLASTSAALPLAATTLPDTVVLTSNLATVTSGQALVLTATVTPTAIPATGAEQNPTGNVIFYNGTNVIGTVALVASPLGDSSSATLTTQTLAGGLDALSAFYVGDLYFDSGTSNVLSLSIEDFTIVPSPSNPGTNLNIVQGTAGSASFVVTGLGGYNNTVQVVCAVPTQDDMTCTASPQQTTLPGTVSFVVQTFLPGQQTSTTTVSKRIPPLWPRTTGGAALAFLAFFSLPLGRKVRVFTRKSTHRLCIFLALLIGLGTAGIGCTSGVAINGNETPLGVSTLKITATAYIDNTVVSHSIYLTVNVIAPASSQ